MASFAEDASVYQAIKVEVESLYGLLVPICNRFHFGSHTAARWGRVSRPMVVVLGNHSAGKSTLINHILKSEIQKSGRAPTDSTFTIITGGKKAEHLDGVSLSRSQDFGFSDFEKLFGREFISQVELKVIAGSPLLDRTGLMIVDSPGMIDPPGNVGAARTDMDRGYDFKRVVQWFADRADVILLLFDPDKPGTTFETLNILTTALSHVTQKVLIILNKVDDFKTVHDFARAYGTLCWNLSKVINRKDLPRIYTMFVPPDLDSIHANPEVGTELQKLLRADFGSTREEVIKEVERAPERRIDNAISDLKENIQRLQIHVAVMEACRQSLASRSKMWRSLALLAAASGQLGAGVVAFTKYFKIPKLERMPASFPWKSVISLSLGSLVVGAVTSWLGRRSVRTLHRKTADNLTAVFNERYKHQIEEGDQHLQSAWISVEPNVRRALEQIPIENLPCEDLKETILLAGMLKTEIPNLDRKARHGYHPDYEMDAQLPYVSSIPTAPVQVEIESNVNQIDAN